MTLYYLLWASFLLWASQQVNDFFGAWGNRKNVPKMYWLSAGVSLLSGITLFAFLSNFLDSAVRFAVFTINALH